MSKVTLARSGAIFALALFAASCGSSDDGSAASSTTDAPATTTTEATTTTAAAPTAEEISDTYCETARTTNAAAIEFELENGPGSNISADYLDVGLSGMESLETVPEDIAVDFQISVEALTELRDLVRDSDGEPTNEEFAAIFDAEVRLATDALDAYEEEVCGFTYDEMAAEAGLNDIAAPAASDRVTTIEGSEVFVDPEGAYSIEVNPDWAPDHGAIAVGIELWFINDGTDGFAENLNLLTSTVGDMTLESFLELSAESIPVLLEDGAVLDQGIVQGSEGQDLGFLLYEGAAGDGLGTFLAVFALSDTEAVIATFVALPDEFDEIIGEVEDYMFTLLVE